MIRKFQKVLWMGMFLCGLWLNTVDIQAAELLVTAESAVIRSEASTESEPMGNVKRGTELLTEETVQDAAGTDWYKVPVDGNTYGYIRSDLVEVTGGTTGNTQGTLAAEPEPTVANPIPEQRATIKQVRSNVRSGASTDHSVVRSLPQGTEIILFGETSDNTYTWYQMKGTVDGEEITGYVREDMINMGDVIEPAPEETDAVTEEPLPPEETGDEAGSDVPADAGTDDYFITREQDEQGGFVYYLNSRLNESRVKVDDFLESSAVASKNEEVYKGQISKNKTIIVILAIFIVVLMIAITVLIFKIRDMYDDYDDDEYNNRPGRRDDGPEDGFTKRRDADDNRRSERRGAEASGRRPGGPPAASGRRPSDSSAGSGNRRPSDSSAGGGNRRPSDSSAGGGNRRPSDSSADNGNRRPGEQSTAGRPGAPAARRPEDTGRNNQQRSNSSPPAGRARGQRAETPELQAAERVNERAIPARKPQNFLNDDDEFEFEFLNIDDK